MTDPTGTALLAGVLADPADDTARLVYADWLQEQGEQERAEFVRVQVELARGSARADVPRAHGHSCQRKAHGRCRAIGPVAFCDLCAVLSVIGKEQRRLRLLAKREQQLIWQCDTDWRADFARSIGDDHEHYYAVVPNWRRGFVESVTCSAADWLRHADAITAAHPVERVTLTSLPDHVDAFCINNYFAVTHRAGMSVWTSLKWKGVEFEFPAHGRAEFADLNALLRRIRNAAPSQLDESAPADAGSPAG